MVRTKIDTNLFSFFEYAALAFGKPCSAREGYSVVDLRPSPWARGVFRLDLSFDENLPKALAERVAAEEIPNRVRLGPTTLPAEAGRLLENAGFVVGRMSRGMSLELKSRLKPTQPNGLDLTLLSTDEEYSGFSGIVTANLFSDKPESVPVFAGLLRSLGAQRCFGVLGLVDGEPVSTAFAYIDEGGMGGLYFVATATEARGRGFGSATVSAALGELERWGASSCILHATELGRPVYAALGFSDDCALPIYSLPEGRLDS